MQLFLESHFRAVFISDAFINPVTVQIVPQRCLHIKSYEYAYSMKNQIQAVECALLR